MFLYLNQRFGTLNVCFVEILYPSIEFSSIQSFVLSHGFKEGKSEFTSFNFELVILNFESLSISFIHKPSIHPFPWLTKAKAIPFGLASITNTKPNSNRVT